MKSMLSWTLAAAVAASAIAAAHAQGAQDAERLLKAAMNTELVDGNLKAAIEQYKKVVQSGNRPLAAQALLHIAECYQKLGDAQTRTIYERVVKEYPEQTAAVATARLRLEDPNAAKAALQRQVWTGPKVDVYGSISPDGRVLSFVDWANHGALAIHDLTTGDDRTVEPAGEAEYSTISKDGKRIAYSWFKRDLWRYEVRLANLTGDARPRQLFDNPEVIDIEPYDWTPDGKWIAVGIKRADRTAQIGLLSTENGKLNVLKSAEWRGPTRMFFSPDGQYLAFDMAAGDGESQRDVYVIAVDGSKEIAAVVDPNQDIVMGWARGMLLFASDRSGSMGLWGLPFQDGKVQGPAQLLKADLGTFESSLGISNSGALFFGRTGVARNVQIAGIDWNTGRLTGPPADAIRKFVGSNSRPSWSRDGRYLGCISLRDRTDRTVLPVVNVETGMIEREIRPRMSFVAAAHLSPDARTFVVDGTDLKGRQGVFLLTPDTGDATPVAVSDDPNGSEKPDQVTSSDWSADGTKIYYLKIAGNGAWRALMEKDLASGAERELLRSWGLGVTRVSPDGKWIAIEKADSAGSLKAVVTISAAGAPVVKELYRAKTGEDVRVAGWTPEGEALVAILPISPAKPAGNGELWAVSADERRIARKLEPSVGSLPAVPSLVISPHGRYIAFVKNGPSVSEVSVLENFLPKAGGK
jgi:Tol biopolymer transport system component